MVTVDLSTILSNTVTVSKQFGCTSRLQKLELVKVVTCNSNLPSPDVNYLQRIVEKKLVKRMKDA